MKMVVNGVEMEVESLKIVEIVEEPWGRYIAVDALGNRFEVRVRATVHAVRRLPIKNPDGTPGYWVGNNVTVHVEEEGGAI